MSWKDETFRVEIKAATAIAKEFECIRPKDIQGIHILVEVNLDERETQLIYCYGMATPFKIEMPYKELVALIDSVGDVGEVGGFDVDFRPGPE